MTTGTKIFLAVFAALIGVMVVYYGVLLPKTQLPPAISVATHDLPLAANPSPAPVSEVPAAIEVETSPAAAPTEGLLTQSIQNIPVDENIRIGAVGEAGEASQASPPPPMPAAEAAVEPPAVEPSAPAHTPPLANQPVNLAGELADSNERQYVIQPGDTMSSIAANWFGDPNKWSLIAKKNPLVDPNRLVIGEKLQLPSKDAKPAPVKESIVKDDSTFTVRSGDTLAKIAREYYGDVARWKAIYDANRAVIGSDPAALKPGMKLKMPPRAKPSSN